MVPHRLLQPTALHIEVCPPRPFGDDEPLVKRLWRSLSGSSEAPFDAALQRMRAVREEFSSALDDVDTPHAHSLQQRLLHCRSMRELWHLRSELFDLVARQHSQHEAERRMAALNRHFPTRSPRSGFVPLDL
jgi:hypothetical protein